MSEASAWLRFLLGLDSGEVPSGGDSRFELTGLWRGGAGWVAFLLIAAAIALIVALYRSEREISLVRRTVLAGLRLLALLVVIWMLLDPRILTELQLKRAATTFVLLDASGSMSTQDSYDGKERKALETVSGLNLSQPTQRVPLALAAIEKEKLVDRLAEKNRVKSFTFDETLHAVEKLDGTVFKPPGGDGSRPGDAVRDVLQQAGQEPIAAVVIITDGRSTGGISAAKAAAEASQRGVPVFAVSVGRTREPKNYAVSQLSGPDVAVPGFPVRLEGRVEVSGLRGPLTVTLLRQLGKTGPKEKVEDRQVEGKSLTYSTSLVFVDTLEQKGSYRYTLSIAKHAEESDGSDNQRTVQVTVAEEKCRVLVVAGGPTPELKFLSRFLIRDDGLQASCWLSTIDPGMSQDGDVTIRELPQSKDALRPYDVVVLLDPDPKSLSDKFLDSLKDFVFELGGGVAYVAGEYFVDDLFRLERLAPLRAILPIDFEVDPPARPGHRQPAKRAWRAILTRQGSDHPLCRLVDNPQDNERVWSELPGLYYNVSVRSLKPAASALLEKEGGDVVAAVEKAGAGTSLFLSTGDLYYWRSWKEALHERFWGAAVRFLALGKKVSGSGESSLHAERDRYAVGEDVVFEANLTDPERKPLLKDRIELAVERIEADPASSGPVPGAKPKAEPKDTPSSVRLNLLPISNRPGWYSGRYRPETAGRFVALLPGAEESGAGRVAFGVVSPSSEWEDPTPDPAALEEMARPTGGAYYTLADLGEIPEHIGDRSVTEVIGRTASTVWDSAAVMLLFGLLLTMEWVLRKLWRLN